MARTIPHRELRNNSSAILREVQQGESFEITNHGEVVARLVPPTTPLRTSLRVRKATRKDGFTVPRIRRRETVQEAIDELRGDR